MKLPRLCFFLHIGLTKIFGFLKGDGLWDDIEKEEGYAMTMEGGRKCLNGGGDWQE